MIHALMIHALMRLAYPTGSRGDDHTGLYLISDRYSVIMKQCTKDSKKKSPVKCHGDASGISGQLGLQLTTTNRTN